MSDHTLPPSSTPTGTCALCGGTNPDGPLIHRYDVDLCDVCLGLSPLIQVGYRDVTSAHAHDTGWSCQDCTLTLLEVGLSEWMFAWEGEEFEGVPNHIVAQAIANHHLTREGIPETMKWCMHSLRARRAEDLPAWVPDEVVPKLVGDVDKIVRENREWESSDMSYDYLSVKPDEAVIVTYREALAARSAAAFVADVLGAPHHPSRRQRALARRLYKAAMQPWYPHAEEYNDLSVLQWAADLCDRLHGCLPDSGTIPALPTPKTTSAGRRHRKRVNRIYGNKALRTIVSNTRGAVLSARQHVNARRYHLDEDEYGWATCDLCGCSSWSYLFKRVHGKQVCDACRGDFPRTNEDAVTFSPDGTTWVCRCGELYDGTNVPADLASVPRTYLARVAANLHLRDDVPVYPEWAEPTPEAERRELV